MRSLTTTVCSFALVIGGCSGSHPLGNGSGGNDMTVGGTGGNGNGGSGGTGGAPMPDMSAVMPACDVATQSGCPTGDKCIPSFGSGGGGACVPTGTVLEGQPCTPSQTGRMLNDNCAGGLICDNDGPGSTNVCRKVCTADSGCSGGERCGAILGNANYGICLPTCTAFGSGCPAGNDCSVPFDDISATNATETGFFVCKKTGTVGVWQSCQQDSDCAAGLACDYQAGCFPVCDASHACGDGPGDGGVLSCSPLVSQPNGAGYCN